MCGDERDVVSGEMGGGEGVSESVAAGLSPDFLLPPAGAKVAELPLSSAPPPTRRFLVYPAGPGLLLPFPLRSPSAGARATGLAGGAPTFITPPFRLTLSAFPPVLTQGRERARKSRSEEAEGEWCRGKEGGNKIASQQRTRSCQLLSF